jgi:hypothetical protein
MHTFTKAALLIVLILLVGSGSTLSAIPPSAPVSVEYAAPAPMKTGDEATTVLTFRALADLDRLDVSVVAYQGLEIVSEPKAAIFQGVKKGEGRQLTVTVRLTDPKVGALAIFFTTQRGKKRESDTTGIAFGSQ